MKAVGAIFEIDIEAKTLNYFEEKTVKKLLAKLKLQVEAKTESMDKEAAELKDLTKTSEQKFKDLIKTSEQKFKDLQT
jgi:arsenate reductase-like glutaredoxin family protein